MRGQHDGTRLGTLLAASAVAVVLVALPYWANEGQSLSRQTQDRLTELEKGQRKAMDAVAELDTRTTHVEAAQTSMGKRLDEVMPKSARWILLEAGGNEQWDFPAGGRAQVQFLSLSDDGAPIFRLQSRGVEADFALSVGTAIEAIDDLGSKRRIYVTTLHRVARDRDGKARAALISQIVREE